MINMIKISQAITEAAMNGEIDFKESLRRRVALLQGTSVDVLRTVRDSLTFTEGARFLCRALKRLGFKLAVISGKHYFIMIIGRISNSDYTCVFNQRWVHSPGELCKG